MLANRVRMTAGIGEENWDEYLATNDDFVRADGTFVYRGSASIVYVPHIIQGDEVTTYKDMFKDRVVSKVISDNPNIITTYRMFQGIKSRITLDLSDLDTSSVVDMSYMFDDARHIHFDLSKKFNTSSVTDMSNMFRSSRPDTLNLSNFDTSSVVDMSNMFWSTSTNTLYLLSFDTSSVTNMSNMFRSTNTNTLDLSSFDTSSVTNMSGMFASSKIDILDLSSFDTSSVTNSNIMFAFSTATVGYARTQADADFFNATSFKPEELNFIVHPDLVT